MTTQELHILTAAVEYERGDARRVQHFIKVHDIAMAIAVGEGVNTSTLRILSAAAILHDIGIHEAERKYHNSSGPYQELEGPAVARTLMDSVGGYSPDEQERICWLIAHHHHVANIRDIDHLILVEADYLVNIYEDALPISAIADVKTRVFKTATGLRLLDAMYPTPEKNHP